MNIGIVKLSFKLDWKNVKPVAEKLIEGSRRDSLEVNTDNTMFNKEQPTHLLPELESFYAFLKPHYLNLAYNILKYPKDLEIVVLHSWFNRYNDNGYIKTHDHAGAIISSALYLEVPKNSGDLLFRDPYYDFKKNYSTSASEDWLWEKANVKVNDLFLFDAAISHRSEPNKSGKERWILGTNIGIKHKKTLL